MTMLRMSPSLSWWGRPTLCASCFTEEPSHSFARLNFSYPTETQIAQGVARFLDAVSEASSHSVSPRGEATATPPVV